MSRQGHCRRETAETTVEVSLSLDGRGQFRGETGIGFFDHMLNLLVRHALFDVELRARGDLMVDGHHTVEDTGLALGTALQEALGDRRGIRRYASVHLPMDEALVLVALDLSNRPYLSFDLPVPSPLVGGFATELAEEFCRALTATAGITLHVRLLNGQNSHHILEALFKGLGRALREAAARDPRETGVPSSKGVL